MKLQFSVIFSVLLMAGAAVAEYTPYLPKTGPAPTKIIIVDLTEDKAGGWRPEILATLSAFQGLVNRVKFLTAMGLWSPAGRALSKCCDCNVPAKLR